MCYLTQTIHVYILMNALCLEHFGEFVFLVLKFTLKPQCDILNLI